MQNKLINLDPVTHFLYKNIWGYTSGTNGSSSPSKQVRKIPIQIQILIRIQPLVLHMLENQQFFETLILSNASCVVGVIIIRI
jgi:hypothetical protein